MAISQCDFCSSPKPVWTYHGMDTAILQVGEKVIASDAAWAACDDCAAIIETKDRASLKMRCLEAYLGTHPEDTRDAKQIEELIDIIHGAFWLVKHGNRSLV